MCSKNIDESLLLEKTRQELIAKSRSGRDYKDKSKGRNRWERRLKSRISNSVRDYNQINMDGLFKGDILEFGVKVQGETDNYVVTVIFENVIRNLQQEVKANNNKLEFKCVLRALLNSFNSGNIYIGCNCLHPDTKIKLLDGTVATIKELCDRYNNGEQLYVYSTDEKGDFKPGVVEKVWQTKVTKEFIKIILDNGQEILTTPEHPYMLRDGTYKIAEDLKEGQSLMPMYFNSSNGYETVKFNSEERGWHSVYKLVADYFKHDEIEEAKDRVTSDDNMSYDIAIHHKDFNKKNNTPENLQVMTAREHWEYHANLTWENKSDEMKQHIRESARRNAYIRNANPTENMIKSRKEWQEKGRLRNYDEDRRQQQSQLMKETINNYYSNLSQEEHEQLSKEMSKKSKDMWERGCFKTQKFHDARVRCGREFFSNKDNQKKFVEQRVLKILQELIDLKLPLTEENYELHRRKTTPHIKTVFGSFDEAVSYFNLNHKIIKIERVILENTPVYDMKVKEWNNFVVDAGVVLHNCPDFRYRFSHHATENGYSSVMPEIRPNRFDWTNANDDMGSACKHVNLVISNLDWMMKIASVINNYIKYCKENMARNYADYLFPAIYGMPYNKAVQLSLFDDPDDNGYLLPDAKSIFNAETNTYEIDDTEAQNRLGDIIRDTALKGRDDKGRWTSDNPYKFKRQEPKKDTSQEDENALNLKFNKNAINAKINDREEEE